MKLEELFDAFPARSYEISGLMRLIDIVEDERIPTAQIESRDAPRIRVNPQFLERYAPTPERRVALILHELLHLLLGHQHRPVTPLENFVFDAVINAMITRMTESPAYWSLFTAYYRSNQFPECLLRPPTGYRPRSRFLAPHILYKPELKEALAVYKDLYDQIYGASYSDVLRILQRLYQSHPELFQAPGVANGESAPVGEGPCDGSEAELGCRNHDSRSLAQTLDEETASEQLTRPREEMIVPLLGSHPIRAGELRGLGQEFRVTIWRLKEIFGYRLPSRSPYGNGEISFQVALPKAVTRKNAEILMALIRQVARAGNLGDPLKRSESRQRAISAVPALDRRSNVLRCLGLQPLLYGWETPVPERGGVEPVHVYVDVSGSVDIYIPCLYQAVVQSAPLVYPRVHLFSTSVETITLEDLHRGVCGTTGGTEINCVLSHMERKSIRRAVILTDGYVGLPSDRYLDMLKWCHLGVAITPGGSFGDLGSQAKFKAELDI
ncbi:MAG: hypothetical protein ACP5UT_06345 [Bryobacteraceae bacterium]